MTTLGELIGGLAAAVTRAGAMSDAASARIAAEYRSDPVLRSMSVPRSGVDGVEFRIVFAFADPAVAPWPAPAPGTGGGAPRPSFGPSRGGSGGGSASPGTGDLVDALERLAHDIVDHGPVAGLFRRGVLSEESWKLAIPDLRAALTDALQGQRGKALDEAVDAATGIFGRFLSRAVAGAGRRRRCVLCFWRRGRTGKAAGPPPDPETLSALRGEIARRASAAAAGQGAAARPPAVASPGPDLAASRTGAASSATVPSAGPAPTPARPSSPGPAAPEDLRLILDPHVLARLPPSALQQMAVTISSRPGEPAQVAFLGPATPPASPAAAGPSPGPGTEGAPAGADPGFPSPAPGPSSPAGRAAPGPDPAPDPGSAPAGGPAAETPNGSDPPEAPGIRIVPPSSRPPAGSVFSPRQGRRRRLLRRRRDLDG